MSRQEKILAAADYHDPQRVVGGAAPERAAQWLAIVGAYGGSTHEQMGVLLADAARYLYPWRRVRLGNAPLFSPVIDSTFSSATISQRAINLAELTQTAKSGTAEWYVGGIMANPLTEASSYPAGFAPRFVGQGAPVVVRMWYERTEDGAGNPILIPVFHQVLVHDGSCGE